jgi:restriction-modification enzyme MmeI-like protein
MTWTEFKKKWERFTGKETSAYQEHFSDLCRLLGQPTPNEADPSGTDFFCYQKHVVKDAELLDLESSDAGEPVKRGFADVWKKSCFGWEYKVKHKNLDEAYRQLQRYREALLNPPLLVVCDFDRYIVKTNFNGTVQEVHEFTNAEIDRPENLRILRALFSEPEFLKPQRTTAQVTKDLAVQIAEIAKSLQNRESVELADAKSRKEVNVAQKKNLRIARFLNRIVFCFFAEDTGLLPKKLFTEIAKSGIDDPKLFAETLEKLFTVMAKGGTFGKDKIRYFNGHLFEEASVFELTEAELRQLANAGEADWQFIEPSIMGTLFERALEPEQRSQLGAHYTSEADIKTLVEPVLMQPFRREWAKIKGELAAAYAKGKGNAAQRERLAKFQQSLAAVTVLDPACGSGNFLYVSLQLLLGLEKEVITFLCFPPRESRIF